MSADPFDAVAADFKRLETRSFRVPEWDGMKIFVRPMTLGDRTRLQEKTKRLDQFETAAMTVCLFARGADDKLVFSYAKHMPRFKREARPLVVARVAGQILAAGEGADPDGIDDEDLADDDDNGADAPADGGDGGEDDSKEAASPLD